MFLDSGAFWAPGLSFEHSSNNEMSKVDSGLKGLVLFDLSYSHAFWAIPDRWRVLVASSPKAEGTHKWEKNTDPTKFYMKTWSFEEIYLYR